MDPVLAIAVLLALVSPILVTNRGLDGFVTAVASTGTAAYLALEYYDDPVYTGLAVYMLVLLVVDIGLFIMKALDFHRKLNEF